MRTRRENRRFVPTVDGLPLRISPTVFAPTANGAYNDVTTSDPGTTITPTGSASTVPTMTSCC